MRFPTTRYQGSKRRSAMAILHALSHLPYHTVLDAFGGTGAMSYAFKCAGKAVTYNDVMQSNHLVGRALIENHGGGLSADDVRGLGQPQPGVSYGDTVQRLFEDIFFTTEENRWLDHAVGNIRSLSGGGPAAEAKQAMLWWCVFQAALAKRPYNLFHRRNLYMRFAKVKRSFGNKASWDRSFDEHVLRFAKQLNRAVFVGPAPCRAMCHDVGTLEGRFDLVYLDPPYINAKGQPVDYRAFYHFLEGLMNYDDWASRIDFSAKHRRLLPPAAADPWCSPKQILGALQSVFERFAGAHVVLSYRNDGIPTGEDIVGSLRSIKSDVRIMNLRASQYALSTRQHTRELLFIGTGANTSSIT